MSNSISSAIVDGQTITVGAYFQLGDAMGQDVRKTKFYDQTLENPVDICVPSPKDFKHVLLDFADQRDRVRIHRLFSRSYFRIEAIRKQHEQYFVFSNHMRVELKDALSSGELILVGAKDPIHSSEREKTLLKEIHAIYQLFFTGCLLDGELYSRLRNHYGHYINLQNKFVVNNRIQHDGSFYNIKAVEDFLAKYKQSK